jgi:hypothetical protein
MHYRWCLLVFGVWALGCAALDCWRFKSPKPAAQIACESANPGARVAPVERCQGVRS